MAARVEICWKDKTISNLTTKNNKPVEGTKLAQVAAHEAKQDAKGIENAAALSARKLREDVVAAKERECLKATEMKAREEEMMLKIQKVKEVEQVSFIAFNMFICNSKYNYHSNNPYVHSVKGLASSCSRSRKEKSSLPIAEEANRI